MNILTIVGARPQFIKAAAVSRAIREQSATYPDPGAFIPLALTCGRAS